MIQAGFAARIEPGVIGRSDGGEVTLDARLFAEPLGGLALPGDLWGRHPFDCARGRVCHLQTRVPEDALGTILRNGARIVEDLRRDQKGATSLKYPALNYSGARIQRGDKFEITCAQL